MPNRFSFLLHVKRLHTYTVKNNAALDQAVQKNLNRNKQGIYQQVKIYFSNVRISYVFFEDTKESYHLFAVGFVRL